MAKGRWNSSHIMNVTQGQLTIRLIYRVLIFGLDTYLDSGNVKVRPPHIYFL